MYNVFISYAHSDSDEAQRLVESLRAQNVTGFLDRADIVAGDVISSDVRSALKQSTAVIVLLSPRALHSQWVQFEIGAAEALGKKIVPVIVSGEHLEEQLPDILRDRMWIDARGRSDAEVIRDVEHALGSST